MDNEVNKVKVFLLEWLFKFGREPVKRIVLWDLHDYGAIEPHVKWCMKKGYINQIRSNTNGQFSHALTNKGLEFLNKGENNEQ
jgi:hypothetical protein